jgi:energy-coupling factor transporter ATP-binding protein EcfA2
MDYKVPLYDTFNAKYLTYQQVAESFIPNDEFMQLLGNCHTLLMGPRGCGKTTLLKMLSPVALNFLNTKNSKIIKSSINFTAIYIPSDIQWKSQLIFLYKHLATEKELIETITNFLITTNIQMALCKTIYSLLGISQSTLKEKVLIEENICRDLISVWDIEKPTAATFDNIEICLQKRVLKVNSLISRIIYHKNIENISSELPQFVFTDFFSIVSIACKIFEKELRFKEDHKWALCFDEIEIAPKFFQIRLLKYLRSVDQKFLFKLTTTPLVNLENNVIDASQDNDFNAIKLWIHDDTGSVRWREFCNDLITNRLRRQFNNNSLSPAMIFGDYNLDEIIQVETGSKLKFIQGTGKGSSVNILFKDLASKDQSFHKFLENRNVDPSDPYSTNADNDKSIFLKYKVSALYRLMYSKRTRKAPAIHYGIPYLYDIADGNPRSIIGIVNEIISKNENAISRNNYLIPTNRQSNVILDISKKYFNLVKNHPESTLTVRDEEFNLANDILKVIGNYIYSKLVKENFTKNVLTTFTVDREIDQKVIRLLEHALFLGAIVYLDPVESLSNTGLIGKRFRLSYLLTPLFRIPNRTYGQVNLKTIFNDNLSKGTSQLEFEL